MGYFDSVRNKGDGPPAVAADSPSNVIQLRSGLHPYAAAIRTAWLNRLDNVQKPWQQGAAWDTNCFVTARKLIELANSGWAGYTLAEAKADYMRHAPSDQAWDKREKCWDQAAIKAGNVALPAPPPGLEVPTVTILDSDFAIEMPTPAVTDLEQADEDAFWDARPILRHLHDFARARLVSPWAVLGVTLARIVTATPHQVCLPPIVGGKGSLNLFVGLVGRSGSGKGAAESVAAEALHLGKAIVSHNVGSGEGIAHGYMHRTKGDLVWNDDDHAVLFSVPEIDSLAAQGDRKGATLMPQLRSGWTGEALGFGYADPAKRILIPAHEYRMAMVAGIQPGRAACLLDDADGGTPQRFLWMPATDPGAPDEPPVEPTPMTWGGIHLGGLVTIGGTRMKVCQTAIDTIRANRLATVRGEGEALDGHALLAQLKTAAALALLDSRLEVTDDDWNLADTIARKSAAVRGGVVAHLAARARQDNDARAEAEAHRAVRIDERKADSAAARVAGKLSARLRREGEWMSRSALRKCLTSADRAFFEEGLTRAIDAGQIEVDQGATGHGNSTGKYRARAEK